MTSRNDGHGGDPLARLQAFVNTFDAQCRRFGLDAELVVVEWNPPADRPRLHEIVDAAARLRVSAAVHRGAGGAARAACRTRSVLPLFQMIGKNVGIRRSRGEFVLCTNIDIIFSNELVQFFASRAAAARRDVPRRSARHRVGLPGRRRARRAARLLRDPITSACIVPRARFRSIRDGRLVPAEPRRLRSRPPVTIGDGWHMREGEPSLGSTGGRPARRA